MNKNNIRNYKETIHRYKGLLSNVITSDFSKMFDEYLRKISKDELKYKVSELDKSIKKTIDTNHSEIPTSEINSFIKEKINNKIFPIFNINDLSQEQNKVLTEIYTYLNNNTKATNFYEEYYPQLIELEKAADKILNKDKNILFKLFQSKKTKKEVSDAENYLTSNYYKIDIIHNKLEALKYKEISKEDVVEDYKERRDRYNRIIADKLEFDINQSPISYIYISEIEDLVEKIKVNLDNQSKKKLKEKILIAWDELQSKELPSELKKIPIEMLNTTIKDTIPYSYLIDSGFIRLSDLKNETKETLKFKTKFLDEDDIDLIIQTKDDFIKSVKEKIYPKISVDNLEGDKKEFIRLLSTYNYHGTKIEKLENKIYETILLLEETNKKLENDDVNDFKKTALSQDTKNHLNDLKKLVVEYLTSLLENYESYNSTKGVPLTDEELINDFTNYSSTYYALIDSLTGSEKTYSPNDLPSYIVEEVDKVELDTEGSEVTLRPYQIFGAKYALFSKRTLLGDEMGLGKTIQALAVVNHLYRENKVYTIVISPLSVLANWKREVEKWTDLECHIFRGKDQHATFTNWIKNGGVLMTNFEQAGKLLKKKNIKRTHFVIVDEAHYIKNPDAKRSKTTNKLAKIAEYALFMTGTPLENKVREMQQLISVLQPELAKGFSTTEFLQHPDNFKQYISSVYLRRKRDEVLKELPEIEMAELWSDFSKIEQDYYDDAVNLGPAGLMKMRRAGFYGQSTSQSEKIEQLIDICTEAKENGHKVLIFSYFKIVLNALANFFSDKELEGIITGGVSTNQRQTIIDNFSKSNKTVLMSQIEAGGVGLNIQSANIVILCEPQWKPSTENQAISRVYRMGQTRNVIVYRLLTEESIDETMLDILGYKTSIFDAYAKDSVVADAFEHNQENTKVSQSEVKHKVFEVEKKRLEDKEKIAK